MNHTIASYCDIKIYWVLTNSDVFRNLPKCIKKYISEIMSPVMYLRINCPDFLDVLIRCLVSSSTFNGIIHNNITYGEISGEERDDYEEWSDLGGIYKDTIRCDEYQIYDIDICLLSDEDGDSIAILNRLFEQGEEKKATCISEELVIIDNFLTTYGPDKIIFKNNITMTNDMGIHEDKRGNNYCRVLAIFLDEIELENPTLKEFVNGIWTLKSHKFDKWYELYCGISDYENIDGNIKLNLDFDHGS